MFLQEKQLVWDRVGGFSAKYRIGLQNQADYGLV